MRISDWSSDVCSSDLAKLPRLVQTREGGLLKLRWQVPGDLPFPMPVEVRVDGKVVTLPMTDGTGETPAGAFSAVTIGPNSKLLMRSDAIERFQAWRAATPAAGRPRRWEGRGGGRRRGGEGK